MANKPHQKLRLLHLLKLLIEKTDASNGLTTQQIIDELCCIDFDVERKALYRDIQALNQFGLIVEQYGSNEWHLPACLLEPERLRKARQSLFSLINNGALFIFLGPKLSIDEPLPSMNNQIAEP